MHEAGFGQKREIKRFHGRKFIWRSGARNYRSLSQAGKIQLKPQMNTDFTDELKGEEGIWRVFRDSPFGVPVIAHEMDPFIRVYRCKSVA
jgi:hypothetical protein